MPNYELIDRKSPVNLVPGNHIIHQDRWWRVVENYNVLGYPRQCRRMLMIVPDHLNEPNAFVFLEITTEHKIDAYNRKD
jgi:hypothetical protein